MLAKTVIELKPSERVKAYKDIERAIKTMKTLLEAGQEKDNNNNNLLYSIGRLMELRELFY